MSKALCEYPFEQIAINSKAKKKPSPEDFPVYLGLEHLDSQDLQVTRFNEDAMPSGEKLIMQKGDVLFGKRRAYQKKVAIAPFDGIFSAHGMVLRPRTEVVDSAFFPFFISSDYFLDRAISISVGSLSPTVNWGDLRIQKFHLPPIEEQRKAAALLWKIDALEHKYRRAVAMCDEVVKAKFVEMFGDPKGQKEKLISVQEAVEKKFLYKPLDGNHGEKHPKSSDYVKEGIPFILANNLNDGKINLINCAYISETQAKTLDKGFSINGDVLLTHKGTIGRTAIVNTKFEFIMLTPQVTYYRPIKGLNSIYLKSYFETDFFQQKIMNIAGMGSTRAYIGITAQLDLPLLIPSFGLQNQFADFVEKTDQIKANLQSSLNKLKSLKTSLINDIFTPES